MKVKLMLPYYPGAEVAGNEREISDQEYSDMLNEYYSNGYFNYMDRALRGMNDNRYQMMDVIPDEYRIESIESKTVEPSYYQFYTDLHTMEDTPAVYDDIVYPMRTGELAGFILHLYLSTVDAAADGISELSQWVRESYGILKDPRIDDEKRFSILPSKNLIIYCETEQNGVLYEEQYMFGGSVIIDLDNKTNFAIAVNKIKKL